MESCTSIHVRVLLPAVSGLWAVSKLDHASWFASLSWGRALVVRFLQSMKQNVTKWLLWKCSKKPTVECAVRLDVDPEHRRKEGRRYRQDRKYEAEEARRKFLPRVTQACLTAPGPRGLGSRNRWDLSPFLIKSSEKCKHVLRNDIVSSNYEAVNVRSRGNTSMKGFVSIVNRSGLRNSAFLSLATRRPWNFHGGEEEFLGVVSNKTRLWLPTGEIRYGTVRLFRVHAAVQVGVAEVSLRARVFGFISACFASRANLINCE